MAKNAEIRFCPRCGLEECDHDERLLANALAPIGTGTTNIDITASIRWVISLRRFGRTAFIELKREHETLGAGQDMALHDTTGTLTTEAGGKFEQRGFLVRRVDDGIALYTTTIEAGKRPSRPNWKLMAVRQTMDELARFIRAWIAGGHLYYDYTNAA